MSGQVSATTPPAKAEASVGRLLASAVRPGLARHLARLRQSEVELIGLTPRPTVVAVLGVTGRVGASTLAALLAQAMAALAPGRVAALDGDGINQALRVRLGADGSGGLRQMLAAPQVWRMRRLVDRYLAQGAAVPVLAAAISERGYPIRSEELEAGLQLLRRRYPIVVADLPATAVTVAAPVADHVIMVGRVGAPQLKVTRQWLTASRPGRPLSSLTVVVPQSLPRWPQPVGVDVVLPRDQVLAREGVAHLGSVQLVTLATVEAITCRAVLTWRDQA